jgi:integrase
MSIQRRPKKGKDKAGQVKWVVRYRDHAGDEHSKTFTYDEYDQPHEAAKDYDAAMRDQLRRGTWIDPEVQQTTVLTLCEQWRDQAVRDGTVKDRQFLCDNLGPMGAYPAGQVTKSMVTTWVKRLREGRPWADGRPLSEKNVINRCGQLRNVLARAMDDGMIGRNPASHLKNQPTIEARVEERMVPTVEQIKALCAAADAGGSWVDDEDVTRDLSPTPWLTLCIHIAMETGLRSGEVAGLMVRDVDLEQKILRVRQQCGKRLGEYAPLKSKSSRRDVPISAALARELRSAIAGRGGDEPVVSGARGAGVTSRVISERFPKVRAVAGVPAGVSFHGLRHFFATEMLNARVAPLTVSALLGHGSLAVTAKVYAHWMPGRIDDARGALRSLAGSLRDDVPALRVVSDADLG